MKITIDLIFISLLWLAVFLGWDMNRRIEIAAYRNALSDLRAEAERVNQENTCMWMIFDNYTPNDQIIEECVKLGVPLEKARN